MPLPLGAGIGKSFSLDVNAGGGIGGFGGFGGPVTGVPPVGGDVPPAGGFGGIPFGGGWGGVPYVPVTPLGALEGFKGDLIFPIVAVGVAIFILIIIVLAVKAALAWKMSLLGGLAHKKFARDAATAGGPPHEDQLNQLANVVLNAIQSQTCAQNMICQVGSYARSQQGLSSLLRVLEAMVPSSVQEPLVILRSSAEGNFNCNEKYKCGDGQKVQAGGAGANLKNNNMQPDQGTNSLNSNKLN